MKKFVNRSTRDTKGDGGALREGEKYAWLG